MKSSDALPLIRVRRSKVHGAGVFALRDIKKGARISEYVGDRIAHAEADRRYADKADDDNHTFLFTVDNRIVIDGGVGGSDVRYINHSCDPNCETIIDDRRVFIEAIRNIKKGDELGYDYLIERDPSDAPDIDVIWACRCGAAQCRGTMLLPHKPKRKKTKKSAKKSAKKSVKKKATTRKKKAAPRSVVVARSKSPTRVVRAPVVTKSKTKAKKKTKTKSAAKPKRKSAVSARRVR